MAETDLALVLDRLLAVADPAFVAPPLDAAIAEAVLGPSGAPRTPHRQLLERANGGWFFERALHFFGACAEPAHHSLAAWNSPTLWRDAYGAMTGALVFFAEDAFGDQYAYSGVGGEVVCFQAELGAVVPVAPHFVAWLEALLAAPDAVLPIDFVRREGLDPGQQLYPYPPFFAAESSEGVDVGRIDAVEAMRVRGHVALQIKDLPNGSRIKITID